MRQQDLKSAKWKRITEAREETLPGLVASNRDYERPAERMVFIEAFAVRRVVTWFGINIHVPSFQCNTVDLNHTDFRCPLKSP